MLLLLEMEVAPRKTNYGSPNEKYSHTPTSLRPPLRWEMFVDELRQWSTSYESHPFENSAAQLMALGALVFRKYISLIIRRDIMNPILT